MTRWLMIVMMLVWGGAGCDVYRDLMQPPSAPEPEPAPVQRVADIGLAKLILRPQRERLEVPRDPFMPLIPPEPFKDEGGALIPMVEADFADWTVSGIIKSGDGYLALIKNKTGRGLYRVQDQVQGFTITEITEDAVMLSQGKKTIILKRGGER